MLGTNELVSLVHEDARHIPYPEQFRMELGRVGKGQKSQPSIITLKFEVVVPGRDGHQQLIMVTLLTPVMPNFAPHVTTGLEPLVSRLTGRTGHAYGVVDGQLE